jgi:flagellar biosynthesis protein FliR
MEFESYASGLVFGYLVAFARIGSALMFLPGFGETQIPVRVRLSFALVVSLALYPLTPIAPIALDTPIEIARLLGAEVTIGLWIGLTARIILASLQFAGYQVGQVSGLANAFGPSLGTFQGATLVATFLILSAVALIFATNTHQVILIALLDSYSTFPLGVLLPGALAEQVVRAGGKSLYIGASVAAPFFVVGIVLNLGMGLANRMMMQLPVFFVAASILIGTGLLVLAAAAPYMLGFFVEQFMSWLDGFQFNN